MRSPSSFDGFMAALVKASPLTVSWPLSRDQLQFLFFSWCPWFIGWSLLLVAFAGQRSSTTVCLIFISKGQSSRLHCNCSGGRLSANQCGSLTTTTTTTITTKGNKKKHRAMPRLDWPPECVQSRQRATLEHGKSKRPRGQLTGDVVDVVGRTTVTTAGVQFKFPILKLATFAPSICTSCCHVAAFQPLNESQPNYQFHHPLNSQPVDYRTRPRSSPMSLSFKPQLKTPNFKSKTEAEIHNLRNQVDSSWDP